MYIYSEKISKHVEPFKTAAEAPAKSSWVIPNKYIPVIADNIKAEGALSVSHDDTCNRQDGNDMAFSNDPSREWHRCTAGNDLGREVVQMV